MGLVTLLTFIFSEPTVAQSLLNEIKLGEQTWMTENLNVDKFRNGDPILEAKTDEEWQKAGKEGKPAWCYYNNNSANGKKYGKLYNWYAVSPTTNGNKNVCPTGWHVPSDAEWTVLTGYLGGESVAGGKMKEVGTTNWISPNTDASNTSLFTGLPGGYRNDNGGYNGSGSYGNWWSSSENNTNNAWNRNLNNNNGNANRNNNNKSKEPEQEWPNV